MIKINLVTLKLYYDDNDDKHYTDENEINLVTLKLDYDDNDDKDNNDDKHYTDEINLVPLKLGSKLLKLLGARALVKLGLNTIKLTAMVIRMAMMKTILIRIMMMTLKMTMTWRAKEARASSFCRTFGPRIRSKPAIVILFVIIIIIIIIKIPSRTAENHHVSCRT